MINEKYFYYGLANRYALVDSFKRNIWLLVDDKNIAQDIKRVFSSKLNLLIVDITTYSNYTADLIDNTVCLNWKVPCTNDPALIENSLAQEDIEQVHVASGSECLLNDSLDSILTINRQHELVKQMMLLSQILEMLKDRTTNYDKATLNEIFELFQVEIDLTVIKEKLLGYALTRDIDTTLFAILLYLLNKLYE